MYVYSNVEIQIIEITENKVIKVVFISHSFYITYYSSGFTNLYLIISFTVHKDPVI